MENQNNNEDRDNRLLNKVQEIRQAKLAIQEPKKYHYWLILLLFCIYFTTFLTTIHGISLSDLFLLWTVITPYGLYLANHYHKKYTKKKKFLVFVEEIKELLYVIYFLRQGDNKSQLDERFNLLDEIKNELKRINCYLIKKEETFTLLIYTKQGKYKITKDNIVQVYPQDQGPRSIFNQDNPIEFINKIIQELQGNL